VIQSERKKRNEEKTNTNTTPSNPCTSAAAVIGNLSKQQNANNMPLYRNKTGRFALIEVLPLMR